MVKKTSKYVQQDEGDLWSCKLCPKKGLSHSGIYKHLDAAHTLHLQESEASRMDDSREGPRGRVLNQMNKATFMDPCDPDNLPPGNNELIGLDMTVEEAL